MVGNRRRQISGLLLSLTCALAPISKAYSYDLATSDMGAYRSDVVRRIFDAVKNSSEYKRTIIDLNITAMGKITSCRIVKSSGNLDLDASMMKALSLVNLEPMKFAGSNSDSVQIQICFGNAIPDPKNLYLSENESFTYRSFGTLLQVSGATPGPPEMTSNRNNRRNTRLSNFQTSTSETAPEEAAEYTGSDKTYDQEIEKLLTESMGELVFHALNFYGLEKAPQSSTQLDQAKALIAKGRNRSAAQAYIFALIEPIKNGDVESTKLIVDKLTKLSPSLRGDDRLDVAMSLLNLSQRMKSIQVQFRLKEEVKANFNTAADSLLPLAQQFADDSSTKRLGRLARYYRLRGDVFQSIHDPDKAKIAYQKYLSVTLENEDAQPTEVELAFEKTLDALQSREDQSAIREVENQRLVWLSKHPDPTNLRSINAACRQLETSLNRFPSISVSSGEADESIDRILKLIRTSTLYTQPVPEAFLHSSDSLVIRSSQNQNEDLNRCLQKLLQVNDRLFMFSRSVRSPAMEQLFRETYKLALRTRYSQQMRSFQRLTEYLIGAGKAQEALVLCDLVGTGIDTDNILLYRNSSTNSTQQLRLKALRALGRNAEVDQMEAKIKSEADQQTQSNSRRNLESAEQRLAKAPPYSSERIQAREALTSILLTSNSNSTENMQRAKSNFLESLNEVSSEKFSNYSMSDYRALSNQLTSILVKLREPELEFTTKSVESLLKLQSKNALKTPPPLGSIERALPLIPILESSNFSKHPKMYLALIRNLTKFCSEQLKQDDTNQLVLLRKLAELESKAGEMDNAAKTNLEIVSLLEKRPDKDRTELVRQLISLAHAEAAAGKLPLAKKYQQRAAELNFISTDPATTTLSLINLANIYARKGALKDASSTLLAAVRQPKSGTNSDTTVSARELVRACEARNNFAVAKEYFESAINFEKSRDSNSAVLNLYRADLSELLLKQYSASSDSSQKANLLKQSDDAFQTAADGFISSQGDSSRLLGAAVQRRAFLLTLSGLRDQGDTLLEKYKTAAANTGASSLTMDTNVGTPPPSN